MGDSGAFDGGDWRLGRRPALDGIRGIAIVLVVASHLSLRGFHGGGVAGVTMFFVLSGFLITALLADELRDSGRIDLRAFYSRRALRLLPALGVLLSLAVLESLASGHASRALDQVLACLFYVANWFRAAGVDLAHVDHTWSLAIEEQFYVVWPSVVVALCFRRGGFRGWLLVAALAGTFASVVLRFALWDGPSSVNRVYFGTETRADGLLLGCALALLLAGGSRLTMPGWVLAGVGGCLLAVATWNAGTGFEATWGPTLSAAGGLAVIAAALRPSAVSAALSFRPLRHLGRISYGLYLWHFPIVEEMRAHMAGAPFALYVVAAAAASYVTALVSYRLVELPFLRRKRRFERRVLPAGADVTAAPTSVAAG